MSRAEKKKMIFSQVVNYLKSVKPNLDYNILPQAGIELDPSITEMSSDKKNLQAFKNALKIPILQPFKNAVEELTSTQKKIDVAALDKALESAKQIVTSAEKKKEKKKKSTSVDSVLVNATPVPQPSTSQEKKKKRTTEEDEPKSPPKKVKAPVGKKREKKTNDDYLCEFDNEVMKILFNKQVKWWEPYLATTKEGKKKVTCYCPEREPCKIAKGRFGSKVMELKCFKKVISDQCGFLINLMSMSKLSSFMQEKKTFKMPRPQCSCNGADTVLQIRGTDPKVPVHQLFYFCTSCKNCYFFDDYKSQIDKLFEGPKSKKSCRPEPEAEPEPEPEAETIDVDTSDDEDESMSVQEEESEASESEDEESSGESDEDGN